MGVCVGDLEQRQMERLRVELGEVLAAHVAYPPFFNYRAAQAMVRPLDRSKRDEIDQYLRSVNFTSIERAEVTSPEVRRFLERLILRYIEVNPALTRPRMYRRLPELRSRAPRMAAEVQRGLLALVSGQATAFGTQRTRPAWSGPAAQPHHLKQDREHNTRVLEAILVRRSGALPPLPSSHTPRSAAPPQSAARSWPVVSSDLTVPVPAQGVPTPPPHSPFAGLEVGAQSDVFGSVSSGGGTGAISTPGASTGAFASAAASDSISNVPTGPLGPPRPAASAAAPAPVNMRELPPDLFQLYGDYLRDMEPEAADDGPADPAAPPAAGLPGMLGNGMRADVASESSPFTTNGYAAQAMSEMGSQAGTKARPVESASTRSDKLIFWQLRYQLEAYVRRAARSYGVQTSSGDPSGVIDALRRSRFVDEADLRIAEGILALTDRVTAGVAPTIEDYQQALMLYLLYHRSHLGT
ncbi:MAG TPA: hypothetical protein VKT52_10920 [Ktedonobacterales bacterium]|nr:hypothetical protein [Ktedonobacterales bacterium]